MDGCIRLIVGFQPLMVFLTMVLIRGQQAGDSSSADNDRYPITTGNPMVAHTSNDASGITVSASGDALGSARKPTVHGSQSG